jgi:hypothetical protein
MSHCLRWGCCLQASLDMSEIVAYERPFSSLNEPSAEGWETLLTVFIHDRFVGAPGEELSSPITRWETSLYTKVSRRTGSHGHQLSDR